jgi:hypothetical protein
MGGQLLAVRDTRWKLIFPHEYRTSQPTNEISPEGYPILKRLTQELALYDLQNDVGETRDVKAEHPEIVKRLQDAADHWHKQLGDGKQFGLETRPPANYVEVNF